MANTSILIKRSTTLDKPVSLQSGELGYSYTSNTMFIGTSDGNGVLNVGGVYYTGIVDAATASNTVSTLVKRDAAGNIAVGAITARSITFGSYSIDATTGFSGNANSATQFRTDRYIDVTGGDITASAQLFNGTANATLSASLNTIAGLTAGTYGGSTVIPIIQVSANGRVMTIANSATISTSLNIAGDTGTDAIDLVNDTFTFTGGAGITSTVGTNSVTFDVDTTVVRANTASMSQTIDGDITISGNLAVLGAVTKYDVSTLSVEDSMIALGANNTGDAVDIGFYGHYNDGANRHAGLMRHAGDKKFYLFDSYDTEPTGNVINVADSSFLTSNLVARDVSANIIGEFVKTSSVIAPTGDLSVGPLGKLTKFKADGSIEPYGKLAGGNYGGNQVDVSLVGFGTQIKGLYEGVNIVVSSDGTGANGSSFNTDGTVTLKGEVTANGVNLNERIGGSFDRANSAYAHANDAVFSTTSLTAGAIVIGAGSNNITTLANTTYSLTGGLSTSNTITSLTVDAYGRVTAATGVEISGLSVAQGGTGASTFTAGRMLVGNGTGAIQAIANVTYTLTGTLGAAKTITSLTVDDYGRVSAATAADISGLTVAQGGTGASTFTAKGIVYGDGTNALSVTAAAGTSDQTWSNQILTTTNAGVPVWTSTLDGGQF